MNEAQLLLIVVSAVLDVGFRMMKVEGLITLRTVLFVSLHLRQRQEATRLG